MPGTQTMDEWKSGTLHSGSKNGPVVTNQKQAVAIMLNERRKAKRGATTDHAAVALAKRG